MELDAVHKEQLVKTQYQYYPYPPRHPADEANRLIEGYPSHLLEINHYIFGGRRDFSKPFRVLIAGGGTGDGLIMLAQHLADRRCPAEIVYLDLSETARDIAKARADQRALRGIRYITASIFDLPKLALGSFDYIDCCGVLHHLEDPLAGLRILTAQLSPQGGIGIMLYGALGRIGVYHLQSLLKNIFISRDQPLHSKDGPWPEPLAYVQSVLNALPATNWLKRNPAIADYRSSEPAQLVDLLLHPVDRAFEVPEVAALAENAGLEIVAFLEPWRYDPNNYGGDARLKEAYARMDPMMAAHTAELLAGNIKTHVFYAVPRGRKAEAVCRLEGADVVPVMRSGLGADWANAVQGKKTLTVTLDGLAVRFALPPWSVEILKAIDGQHDLQAIGEAVGKAHPALSNGDAFKTAFSAVYQFFHALNHMFLFYPRNSSQ